MPASKKFNHKYDQECFMCNKNLKEDLQQFFIDYKVAKDSFEYLKVNFLVDKSLTSSLILLGYKRSICEDDFRALSNYVYIMCRIRNTLKHKEKEINPFELFKVYFNKWLISLTSI